MSTLVVAAGLALVGCKDTRTTTRPPPAGEIAVGATHAELLDPSGQLTLPKSKPAEPAAVDNPFDVPPENSSNVDPFAPTPKVKPTHL